MAGALRFDGPDPARQLADSTAKQVNRLALARANAARAMADTIEKNGRSDIAGAGNFGQRWQSAWTARMTPANPKLEERCVIETFFDGRKFQGKDGRNYAHVFEFSATIKAKNPSGLLWIPFKGAEDAIGLNASEYPLPLFRFTSKKGNPILALRQPAKPKVKGAPKGAAEKPPLVPKYFGKPSVFLPQKFHLRDVGTAAARQYPQFFAQNLKAITNG